jgi:hypothetical protein
VLDVVVPVDPFRLHAAKRLLDRIAVGCGIDHESRRPLWIECSRGIGQHSHAPLQPLLADLFAEPGTLPEAGERNDGGVSRSGGEGGEKQRNEHGPTFPVSL